MESESESESNILEIEESESESVNLSSDSTALREGVARLGYPLWERVTRDQLLALREPRNPRFPPPKKEVGDPTFAM